VRFAFVFPQAKPSLERIAVVAKPAPWRQLFQFLGVAASQNHLVRFKGGRQSGNHVRNIVPPSLLAEVQECCVANIALVRFSLVRKMAQFHGLHNAIDNERRPESGSQSQEEHLPFSVAAQALHRCIIYQLYWTAKSSPIVKAHPSVSKMARFRNRPVS